MDWKIEAARWGIPCLRGRGGRCAVSETPGLEQVLARQSRVPFPIARSDMSLMQWRILRYDSYLAT